MLGEGSCGALGAWGYCWPAQLAKGLEDILTDGLRGLETAGVK